MPPRSLPSIIYRIGSCACAAAAGTSSGTGSVLRRVYMLFLFSTDTRSFQIRFLSAFPVRDILHALPNIVHPTGPPSWRKVFIYIMLENMFMKRFFSEKSGCVSAAASFTEMIYFTFFSSISQRISYGSLASPTISKDSIRNRLKCGSFFPP